MLLGTSVIPSMPSPKALCNTDYFETVRRLQLPFMAAFGRETEEILNLLHPATRKVEIASHMLGKPHEP
jgi:hypothetical protein